MDSKKRIKLIEVTQQTVVSGEVCKIGDYKIPDDYSEQDARALIIAGKAFDKTPLPKPREIPTQEDLDAEVDADEFKKRWAKLGKDKFREFMDTHIADFYKTTIENVEAAREKWERFFEDEPFPITLQED